MGKIENLPKWAQRLITKLERDREYYQRKVNEMAGEVDHDTNTEIRTLDENIRLPNDSRIVFTILGATRRRSREEGIRVSVNVKDGELILMAHEDALAFVPLSSNTGKVRIVEW